MHGVNAALDAAVARVQGALARHDTHVYAVMWGVAFLAFPLVAAAAAALSGVPAPLAGGACVAVLLAYNLVYLRLKRRLFPGAKRKLVTDWTIFGVPAFVGLLALAGVPPAAALDQVALMVPPYVVLLRTGCFLGGCCHGRASACGVRYPDRADRVLPLPLFEAAVGLGLVLFTVSSPPGERFARVLVGYGLYRVVAEQFRPHVPRVGPLSRTQLLAAVGAVVGGLMLTGAL